MSDRIDLLDRGSFIENVIKIVNQLSENKKGCCFAIEGEWGVGKTFVIEEIEEQLKEIRFEETNTDKYFVFHYNCWQHDYYEEPAVAIISAMLASIQEDNVIISENIDNIVKASGKVAIEKLKEIAGTLIENRIGVNFISIAENLKEQKEEDQEAVFKFDKMFNFSQTIEEVRKNLQEVAEERAIVLVVDELDRCIPQYAIKVLERLHHIFYGLENVVVIMAIDRTQLEHSVEEMFGKKSDCSMNIDKYLKKFIDFSVVLDNGKVNESLREKYDFYFQRFEVERGYDSEKADTILTMLLSEIDIRRQEKIIEKANLVHSLICNDKVHISVLVFEIMYEIIKIWGIGMTYILEINVGIVVNTNSGKEEILKNIVEDAYGKGVNYGFRPGRRIKDNLYGDVFFYFWRIFNNQKHGDIFINGVREKLKIGEEIARKYCEFCEIIK